MSNRDWDTVVDRWGFITLCVVVAGILVLGSGHVSCEVHINSTTQPTTAPVTEGGSSGR